MNADDSTISAVARFAARWSNGPPPDLRDFLATQTHLSIGETLEVCCLDLRERIGRSLPARAEDYSAPEVGIRHNPEAMLDLIYTEYLARRDRGRRVNPHELARRFPDLAERIDRLLRVDELLAPQTTRSQVSEESPLQTTLHRPLHPARSDSHPSHIGRYAILRQLDAGGQGVIFQAMHPTLGTAVVIKWSHDSHGSADREALIREGQALARLDHPALCRVYDLEFVVDRPFVVMEFIPGLNLHQRVEEATVAPATAARWMAAVARGLEVAHQRGLVHRDIKPKNVVIGPDDQPRLIDFGLVKTRTAWDAETHPEAPLSGSVAFMPPEQANGRDPEIGVRSDIFSLGATLFYTLTRQSPIPGKTFTEVLANARRGLVDMTPLEQPAIPRDIAAICRQCLSPRIEDRPARARDVAIALERAIRPPTRRLRILSIAGSAISALGFGLWFGIRPSPPVPGTTVPEVRPVSVPITLSLRVWVADRYVPLPEPAPVRQGARVRLEARLAAAQPAVMLMLASDGHWTRLARRDTSVTGERFSWPAEVGKSVRVTDVGNQVVILLAGPAEALERVETALTTDTPEVWPALPITSVLSLEEAGVKVLQKGRDFGAAEANADPEGEVSQKLEALRTKLKREGVSIRGVAFRSI